LGRVFCATGDEATGTRIKLCRKRFTFLTPQLHSIKESFSASSMFNAHTQSPPAAKHILAVMKVVLHLIFISDSINPNWPAGHWI
jgi:hypothetical protein